jgi:hypothetical protein
LNVFIVYFKCKYSLFMAYVDAFVVYFNVFESI